MDCPELEITDFLLSDSLYEVNNLNDLLFHMDV